MAERCEVAEGRVQKVEAEAEALREMVANLTEGKVALTTKVCLSHNIFSMHFIYYNQEVLQMFQIKSYLAAC